MRNQISEADYKQKISKGSWQEQAEAFRDIQDSRPPLWKRWGYVSFDEFCASIPRGPASPTAYQRAQRARHERFPIVRNLDITMQLADKLYVADELVLQVCLHFLEYRISEAVLMEILSSEDPTTILKELYLKQANALVLLEKIINSL